MAIVVVAAIIEVVTTKVTAKRCFKDGTTTTS
jgi:hypothetical protein